MGDHFLLTPFFLDAASPGLEPLADLGAEILRPALPGEQRARLAALHRSLAAAVAAALARAERPVSLAGDCCSAIAVAAGLERAGVRPTLIWLDAHGDFNTWETSPSGFIGGMPLAMLCGLGEQTLVEAVGLQPFDPATVLLVDARDLDPGERELVESTRVRRLPRVGALLERPLPAGPLWVHWDVDVLDPRDAPAVDYPVPGGATAAELGVVFDRLAASGEVAAVSVSCWNPERDADDRTARVCRALLQSLLGREA